MSILTYRAPVGGYYQVSAKVYHCVPTNFMVWEENTEKLWWQFWKPRFILKPGFKTHTTDEGVEVKYFKAGEAIYIDSIRL